jgi:hypothetical protein
LLLRLLLLVPLVAAAAKVRTTDPEALLRAGDAAFRASDPGQAAEFYDRAGIRTTEPSRAAFNLATAKYRLAQGGKSEALGDAEVGYRCCLEKGNPYRARALFGLGNCLLLRATSGSLLDRATLLAAIDRFSASIADPRCTASLATDARHNRARARLLLLQAPPPPPGTTDDGSNPDDPKQPDDQQPPQNRSDDGGNDTGSGAQQQKKGFPASSGTEHEGTKREGTTGAGQVGKLPPVSEDPNAVPLARGDATQHVQRAARKILDEVAAYRRGKARSAMPGGRDW